MNNQIDIVKLARDFSEVLQSWLDADEMDKVNALNAAETATNICHSHDFCDANMAMLEAYSNQTGTDEIPEDTAAWNAAWEIAKSYEFNPLNIR